MTADPRYDKEPGRRELDGRVGGRDPGSAGLVVAEDHAEWVSRSRVTLTPIAAPSIMGLFGFMIATLMLGAWQAGWYGSAATPLVIFPFALVAGGLLQSVAAIVSFRARDGVAVAVHTAWGAFWVAWGLYQLLVAVRVLPAVPLGSSSPSFAFWFITLTLVTVFGLLGALAQSLGLAAVLAALTAGAALTAAGMWAGSLPVLRAGGWLFVISAALAWLTAGAMVLEHSWGRPVIPLGKLRRRPGVRGAGIAGPIGYPAGMPGVKVGQ